MTAYVLVSGINEPYLRIKDIDAKKIMINFSYMVFFLLENVLLNHLMYGH